MKAPFSIPTGLHQLAQGCEERATLGDAFHYFAQPQRGPKGVAPRLANGKERTVQHMMRPGFVDAVELSRDGRFLAFTALVSNKIRPRSQVRPRRQAPMGNGSGRDEPENLSSWDH